MFVRIHQFVYNAQLAIQLIFMENAFVIQHVILENIIVLVNTNVLNVLLPTVFNVMLRSVILVQRDIN